MCLVQRGACSQGVPAPGEGWCLVPGGLVSQLTLRQTLRERGLLLRTVRILLECILVEQESYLLASVFKQASLLTTSSRYGLSQS